MLRVEKTDAEKAKEMQRVFEYCMYMMLGSYFKSTHCKSNHLETQLLLYYKEYGLKKVYGLEERVLRLIEREVLPVVPKEYLSCDAKIKLIRNEKHDVTVVVLTVQDAQLLVCGKYNGKESKVKAAWRESPGRLFDVSRGL